MTEFLALYPLHGMKIIEEWNQNSLRMDYIGIKTVWKVGENVELFHRTTPILRIETSSFNILPVIIFSF